MYNFDSMLLAVEKFPNMRTFPYGNVVVNTPSLLTLRWDLINIHTIRDLYLTIYYVQNSGKLQGTSIHETSQLKHYMDV